MESHVSVYSGTVFVIWTRRKQDLRALVRLLSFSSLDSRGCANDIAHDLLETCICMYSRDLSESCMCKHIRCLLRPPLKTCKFLRWQSLDYNIQINYRCNIPTRCGNRGFFGVLCKTQDGYLQNSYYEMELDVLVLPKYKLSNRSLINYPDRFGKFSQDYLVMDRYI